VPLRLFHRPPPPAVLSPPACPGDFPDPFVLATGEGYVAYATNANGVNVQVRTSTDLHSWTARADALPELPAWAAPGRTWSPSALTGSAGVVLWYVAHHAASGRQAISCASATGPLGPFEDRSSAPALLQSELGGSIDPSPFVDADGTAYLYWKADANALGRASSLWGAPLRSDGAGLADEPRLLLGYDRPWEEPLIEAPCVTTTAEGYLMFYSAGRWNTPGYAIGLARAPHPLGPWRKMTTRGPWAASDAHGAGPGGQECFAAPDGSRYLAYHAWEPGRVTYRAGGVRSLRIGVLDLSGPEPLLGPLPPPAT